MSSTLPEMSLKIIGTVRNEMKEPGGRANIKDIVSEIVLDDSLAGSLDNIDTYDYITVIYYFHKSNSTEPKPTRVHPHRNPENPLVGIFATRGPDRPNSMGMGAAKILEVGDTTMKVSGLDAIDGSPIIDIKPYNPKLDTRPSRELPSWT